MIKVDKYCEGLAESLERLYEPYVTNKRRTTSVPRCGSASRVTT